METEKCPQALIFNLGEVQAFIWISLNQIEQISFFNVCTLMPN